MESQTETTKQSEPQGPSLEEAKKSYTEYLENQLDEKDLRIARLNLHNSIRRHNRLTTKLFEVWHIPGKGELTQKLKAKIEATEKRTNKFLKEEKRLAKLIKEYSKKNQD